MTLDEIRSLLAFSDARGKECGNVNSLLDEHIGHVTHRIAELKTLERQLKELRSECKAVQAAEDCGILRTLGSRARPVTKGNHGHGGLNRTHK